MVDFTHLHVHTQYSILDGAANIKSLLKRAKEFGMDALAITDHGNMYGVYEFFKEAKNAGIKAIAGCEVYVTNTKMADKSGRGDRSGQHLILLAKNKNGYKNLSKIVSIGFTEGFYYTPRIDKSVLEEWHEDLICCSACLGGEIPKLIINEGIDSAEKAVKWYQRLFGEDYYLEVQRHGHAEQERVIEGIKELCDRTGAKCIATNDIHFVDKDDYDAHKILIALNTGKDLDDSDQGMYYTGHEYLKSGDEIAELFKDMPETLNNTREIVDKIESYSLNRDVILPKFPLPDGFTNEFEYLEHLTWEGAEWRWGELDEEKRKRLEYELATVKHMGFPGYFLIVWDFIKAAREMGVRVGPGRGSAAGSVIAYCLGITNIDPMKYDLLFERFLNPERISMPDVDIDFDNEGRESVIQYVIGKYGKDHVAQIITFGTMASKSAIKDVARVLKMPLSEADALSKLVPGDAKNLADAINRVPELKEAITNGTELTKKTLTMAVKLEGSVRSYGTHACGVIIGPEDLSNFVPLGIAKGSDLAVTQYEGSFVESVGLLKMDFLGLKTLSIVDEAIKLTKKSQGIDVDFDKIPLDDKATYELFSRGETMGIFQFESDGMRKHLQDLKPDRFEDLIAMNALYRPGPMEYIKTFIDRKFGREPIAYDIPEMERYLKDTYGITVYQEQVMLLSQSLGGFTGGQADTLRKAMGKKQIETMQKLKEEFKTGCEKNGHNLDVVEKIWNDWTAFAQYAFNKSHSTCYADIAYRTGWLKAHYPSEFMAAVLGFNINNIDEISKYLDECRRHRIDVLGPDVNESSYKFAVNKKGAIRFGLGAIKGVGEGPASAIVEEREKNGPFTDIFNFVSRVNLRTINKRVMEALAMGGAFDCFETVHRALFVGSDANTTNFTDSLVRWAQKLDEASNSTQISLFGDAEDEVSLPVPEIPYTEKWNKIYTLKKEFEVTGFYLSGHPLDGFRNEMKHFANYSIEQVNNILQNCPEKYGNRDLCFGGIITSSGERMTKNDKPFGSIVIEDYKDSLKLMLFGSDWITHKNFLSPEQFVLLHTKIQQRYGGQEYELKITSVELLSEVMEKYAKSITVRMDISTLSSSMIKELKGVAKLGKKGIKLSMSVYDVEDEISLEVGSSYNLLNINEFMNKLNELGIAYKLN